MLVVYWQVPVYSLPPYVLMIFSLCYKHLYWFISLIWLILINETIRVGRDGHGIVHALERIKRLKEGLVFINFVFGIDFSLIRMRRLICYHLLSIMIVCLNLRILPIKLSDYLMIRAPLLLLLFSKLPYQ